MNGSGRRNKNKTKESYKLRINKNSMGEKQFKTEEIIRHLRAKGEYTKKVLPLGGGEGTSNRKDEESRGERQGIRPEVCTTLTEGYHRLRANGETYIDEGVKKEIDAGFQKTVYSKNGISPTVREGHGDVVRILDDEEEENSPKVAIDSDIQSQKVYDTEGTSVAITGNGGGQGAKTGLYVEKDNELKELTEETNQGQRVYDTDGIAKTIAGNAGGQGAKTGLYIEKPIIKTAHPRCGDPERGGTGPLCSDENSFTIDSNPHQVIQKDLNIRKLTPKECERLQGFPDNWTEFGYDEDGNQVIISDTQRYKLIGNAVTVNVIKWLAKRFKNVIEEE